MREWIYKFIVKYIKENGYPPTIREIAAGANKSTETVVGCMKDLKMLGLIETKANSPRAIRVVGYEFVKKEKKEHE